MRILVCGSRDWSAEGAVIAALEDARVRYGPFTLVHGAARGADTTAASWAQTRHDVTEDPHPADWPLHGRGAGFVRNREMVSLLAPGEDLVLAFQRRGSRGTQSTIDLARAAGVEIRIWRCDD